MKWNFIFLLFLAVIPCEAQYHFSGNVDRDSWNGEVYLSLVEDYRKLSGVYSEQLIGRSELDSMGHFVFSGDELERENRIYRIHVDNCAEVDKDRNHFTGHCPDSQEVLFIASNSDSIQFPSSFGKQIFCDIQSENEASKALLQIDSLKEEMRYAFADVNSEANRKLNTRKWFTELKEFGMASQEPLAELYIYSFLSDRSMDWHQYYIDDLKSSDYYEELRTRLAKAYPNTSYFNQFETELDADLFAAGKVQGEKKNLIPNWILYPAILISLIFNTYFILFYKRKKTSKPSELIEKLSNQERKVLDLIIANKTNKEIAEAFFVSHSTVKTHVNNIYKKLEVQSRDEIKNLFSR